MPTNMHNTKSDTNHTDTLPSIKLENLSQLIKIPGTELLLPTIKTDSRTIRTGQKRIHLKYFKLMKQKNEKAKKKQSQKSKKQENLSHAAHKKKKNKTTNKQIKCNLRTQAMTQKNGEKISCNSNKYKLSGTNASGDEIFNEINSINDDNDREEKDQFEMFGWSQFVSKEEFDDLNVNINAHIKTENSECNCEDHAN